MEGSVCFIRDQKYSTLTGFSFFKIDTIFYFRNLKLKHGIRSRND